MENIGERIQSYIRNKGIRVGDFEAKIGVSQGYISKIITREASSIRTDLLRKIAVNYPDINLYWLVLGEGEMILKSEKLNGEIETPREIELRKLLDYYKDLVAELKGALNSQKTFS